MNRKELKAKAKEQIAGKLGVLFLITLIMVSISVVASSILSCIPVVGTVAVYFVTAAFTLSITRVYFDVVAGKKPDVQDVFCGFEDYWSAVKLQLFVALFTFLWSLLFIVPGIIKSYEYSMSFYILGENKGKPALECIEESKALTYGHKKELFVLSLSFTGWYILTYLSCGIAGIWTVPYMNATYTNVYYSLKADR